MIKVSSGNPITEKIRKKTKETVEDYDFRQQAIADTKKARLRLLKRPLDGEAPIEPILPADITRLHNKELGKLYGQFCAMASYAHTQAALASIDWTYKMTVARFAKAKFLITATGKVTDKRLAMEADPEFQKYISEEAQAETTATLLQSVYEGYVLGKEATSREISRRMGLDERGGTGR